MALVNGAQAQMSILAQTPKADFGIATAIAMGAAAITTLAQIAAIKSTTYQGGGSVATSPSADVSGAGGAGAGAQINAVTNTSTILGNQQVYVTETDITSNTKQCKRNRRKRNFLNTKKQVLQHLLFDLLQ